MIHRRYILYFVTEKKKRKCGKRVHRLLFDCFTSMKVCFLFCFLLQLVPVWSPHQIVTNWLCLDYHKQANVRYTFLLSALLFVWQNIVLWRGGEGNEIPLESAYLQVNFRFFFCCFVFDVFMLSFIVSLEQQQNRKLCNWHVSWCIVWYIVHIL